MEQVGGQVRKKKVGRGPAGGRMFTVNKTEDMLHVLEDLKEMRDIVRQMQDTSSTSALHLHLAESYREWSSDKSLNHLALASAGKSIYIRSRAR